MSGFLNDNPNFGLNSYENVLRDLAWGCMQSFLAAIDDETVGRVFHHLSKFEAEQEENIASFIISGQVNAEQKLTLNNIIKYALDRDKGSELLFKKLFIGDNALNNAIQLLALTSKQQKELGIFKQIGQLLKAFQDINAKQEEIARIDIEAMNALTGKTSDKETKAKSITEQSTLELDKFVKSSLAPFLYAGDKLITNLTKAYKEEEVIAVPKQPTFLKRSLSFSRLRSFKQLPINAIAEDQQDVPLISELRNLHLDDQANAFTNAKIELFFKHPFLALSLDNDDLFRLRNEGRMEPLARCQNLQYVIVELNVQRNSSSDGEKQELTSIINILNKLVVCKQDLESSLHDAATTNPRLKEEFEAPKNTVKAEVLGDKESPVNAFDIVRRATGVSGQADSNIGYRNSIKQVDLKQFAPGIGVRF